MTLDHNRDAERERIIAAICARLPQELAEEVGTALRSRRGINFGSSDPEIISLIEQLKPLTEQLEPPDL